MARTTESIFYLPSYFMGDMSSAQRRSSSRVQSGASYEHTRNAAGSDLNDDLFLGSTPDPFSVFDPSLGAIGDGRPSPKTFGQVLNSADIDDIKRSGAGFSPRHKSKYAGLFWPRQSDVALVWLFYPDGLIRAITDGLMPDEYRPRCDLRRVEPPQLYHHGDMSTLRPGDQGMDAATCIKFHNMSTASSGQMPFIATHPSNSKASTPKKVRFDLSTPPSRQSTEEQRAACRAKAREMTRMEAVVAKSIHGSLTRSFEEADEVIDEDSNLTSSLTLTNIPLDNHTSSSAPNGMSTTAEQTSTTEGPEVAEEE